MCYRKELGTAKLLYLYQEQILEYEICYQYSDVARSISTEDNLLQSYKRKKMEWKLALESFKLRV